MKLDLVPVLKAMDTNRANGEARIRQAFLNVPMYYSHAGLEIIARKHKIKVETLGNGDFLLFINGRRNRMKLLGPNRVILYIAAPEKCTISGLFLEKLPEIFNSRSHFTYSEALAAKLKELIGETDKK